MVVLNPTRLTRNAHTLFRWEAFSRMCATTTTQRSTRIFVSAERSPMIHLHRRVTKRNDLGSSNPRRISMPNNNSAIGFKLFGRPEFIRLKPKCGVVRSLSVASGGAGNWSFLAWYMSHLSNRPVMTKAVTSAILTFVGDVICQLVVDQVPSLDMKRTFIFTTLGLVLVGPTLHFWYLYLSKLVTVPGAYGAVLRLLLDQFLFAPIFIGVFLSTLVTLEGRPSQVIPKLQQEWFSSVLANWQLWVPFQFFNFRFVPQQFQVLAANFVALIWNVILSYKAHKEIVAK